MSVLDKKKTKKNKTKQKRTVFHNFLFIPEYFVWKRSINTCSLRTRKGLEKKSHFSIMVQLKWEMSCPGLLKCSPVGSDNILFLMYPLCSFILVLKLRPVSPTYFILQSKESMLQNNIYT